MRSMKWLENQIVRLIAGNLAALLLVIGLPAIALTHTAGYWSTPLAQVAALASVHVAVLAVQVAMTGTPIPRKWNAAAFATLPVFDAAATISYIRAGDAGWAAVALLLTVFAVYVTVWMARSRWESWRRSAPVKSAPTDSVPPHSHPAHIPPPRHEFALPVEEEFTY